jgi:hypothetical protein
LHRLVKLMQFRALRDLRFEHPRASLASVSASINLCAATRLSIFCFARVRRRSPTCEELAEILVGTALAEL